MAISLANRGRKHNLSIEQRLVRAENMKLLRQSIAWKDGIEKVYASRRGVSRNPEHIAKMVATRKARGNYAAKPHVVALIGAISRTRTRTPEERAKIASALTGRKRDPRIGKKAGATRIARRTTPYPEKRQRDPRYKVWRDAVLQRDDYMCKRCSLRDKQNHAHHIREWKDFPELRYEIDNAITLCNGCHTKTHHELRRRERAKI